MHKKTSMNAIQKESKLEDLLAKEEESEEETELNDLESQLNSEKKKEDCLLKSIKEKSMENQYNLAKLRAEEAVAKITQNTQKEVATQRNDMKKKIADMKKRKKLKANAIKQSIMTIRMQIAQKIAEISKPGNQEKCTANNKVNDSYPYCDENFTNNFIKYEECKNPFNFCYVCCENEFGELHIVDRDKCFSSCDSKAKLSDLSQAEAKAADIPPVDPADATPLTTKQNTIPEVNKLQEAGLIEGKTQF